MIKKIFIVPLLFAAASKMLSADINQLQLNETRFSKAAATIMGRELAKRYPGSTALVVTEKNYEQSQRLTTMVNALRDSMSPSIEIRAVDYVKMPPPKNPEEYEMLPLSMMITAEYFDKLIKEYPDCNLIISLVGLPSDAEKMAVWKLDATKRPKLALMFADTENLRAIIEKGSVIVLSYKPGVKFSADPVPEDPKKAFDLRYMLISKENIDKVDQSHFKQQ